LNALQSRKLSEFTFVAFDAETTGLDAWAHRVVEVGAVRFDQGGLRDTYQQLVNPGCAIPQAACAIHGITDAMVAGSPALSSVLLRIIEFFGDSLLVAHNAQFDIGFFDTVFRATATPPLPNPVLCTRELARGLFPGLPNYKLVTLVRRLKIPASRHHRALADACSCAEILRKCINHKDPSWNMILRELLIFHGPLFRFGQAARTREVIEQAMNAGTSVQIEYRDADGTYTLREIIPLSIEENVRATKVIAFCHLRKENRTFRLDRIARIL